MSAVQLAFTLRTSTNVKTVHLLGSWDNYSGQLPLSKDASKAGSWKGNFRFQSSTLKPGQRYWYYYMMDGYHVSHDPAKPATKEPTTGRQLNILEVPKSAPSGPAKAAGGIVTGRPLSPSRIACPKPSKPYASRAVREADYSQAPAGDLADQLEAASLYASRYSSVSPPSSISSGSSISSRSDASSPSSLSSLSDGSASSCRCNRYAITRRGDKVLLDCGGSRCGYSDDSSSGCSSEANSSDEESEEEVVQAQKPIIKTIAPKTSATRKVAASTRRR